jgi:hypothetical protein
MLDFIDNMLRQLFITKVPNITSPLQVRFQPPDDDWRTYVSTLGKLALNVYMVELKENREMHMAGRSQNVSLGLITETPFPRYVDVHYLITAWDPASPGPAVEPTIVEHELLWGTTTALMDADPLTPTKIYFPGPVPAGFPALIQDAELPTTILPHDGFAKHAEFWGTMAGKFHPWRPAVFLVLTLPVTLPPFGTFPMVTTLITEYTSTVSPTGLEVLADIGGTVFDGTVPPPPVPVPGAKVEILDTSGASLGSTTADDQGRFSFTGLSPGNYQLQFSASGHPAKTRNITVPSPTGEYNLTFT